MGLPIAQQHISHHTKYIERIRTTFLGFVLGTGIGLFAAVTCGVVEGLSAIFSLWPYALLLLSVAAGTWLGSRFTMPRKWILVPFLLPFLYWPLMWYAPVYIALANMQIGYSFLPLPDDAVRTGPTSWTMIMFDRGVNYTGKRLSKVYRTSATMDELKEFYLTELKAQGWEYGDIWDGDGATFKKGRGRAVGVYMGPAFEIITGAMPVENGTKFELTLYW